MSERNKMITVIENGVKQSFQFEPADCFVVPPRNDDTTVIANEVKQSF